MIISSNADCDKPKGKDEVEAEDGDDPYPKANTRRSWTRNYGTSTLFCPKKTSSQLCQGVEEKQDGLEKGEIKAKHAVKMSQNCEIEGRRRWGWRKRGQRTKCNGQRALQSGFHSTTSALKRRLDEEDDDDNEDDEDVEEAEAEVGDAALARKEAGPGSDTPQFGRERGESDSVQEESSSSRRDGTSRRRLRNKGIR